MWGDRVRLASPVASAVAVGALAAFVAVGLIGTRAYLHNFLQYRGFAPPREPAFVHTPGTVERILVASPALGGREQEAYVYLPSGYFSHRRRRYPVLYLQDGQNVFDKATSIGEEWHVDETAQSLIEPIERAAALA